jgi:hypothetical protein
MPDIENQESSLKQLLGRMIEARQLSSVDADAAERLARTGSTPLASEDDVLRWLSTEYDVAFTTLD